MRIFLIILISMVLFGCVNSELRECDDLNLEWSDLSTEYRVRFFRAYQFEKEHIDYEGKSCSDFLYTEQCWTDLNLDEINLLKTIILDTSNWVQGTYDPKISYYLYAGYAVFDKANCLVGKIDITEAANQYIFYPQNEFANYGDINYMGFCAMDPLWDSVHLKAMSNYTKQY